MAAKMNALVKAKPEPGLWLEEVPIPQIGINDVLVKIHKTAICGTDVHIYNWNDWAQKTIPVPMAVGHEFVGRVAGWPRSAAMFMILSRATWYPVRGMWFVAVAATVWLAAATCACALAA